MRYHRNEVRKREMNLFLAGVGSGLLFGAALAQFEQAGATFAMGLAVICAFCLVLINSIIP